jgi:hypothetical protein
MKTIHFILPLLLLCLTLAGCRKEESGINVEKALQYQVEKESEGKLTLVAFQELSTKKDNPDKPAIHAVTYRATVQAKEDLQWGTFLSKKQSRFVPFTDEYLAGFNNRESTKAGEKKDVEYTIIFQKQEDQWKDQFGNTY